MDSRICVAVVFPVAVLLMFTLALPGCGGNGPTKSDPPEPGLLDGVAGHLDSLNLELDSLLSSPDSAAAIDNLVSSIENDSSVDSTWISSQGLWIRYLVGQDSTVIAGIILDPEYYDSAALGKAVPIRRLLIDSRWKSARTDSGKAIYLAPVYTEIQAVVPSAVDDLIAQINPALENVGYRPFELLKDNACTVDRFADLSEYGIVRLHSHGSPWPTNTNARKIFTPTGETRRKATDDKYMDDLLAGDIALVIRNSKTYYYVSVGFLAANQSFSEDNLLISLGFNHSALGGWPETIVGANGFSACTAYNGIVSGEQDQDWTRDLFSSLCDTTADEPVTLGGWIRATDLTAPGVSLLASGDTSITLWTAESDDTTPPARITDLSVGAVGDSSVTLTWTAPGDDGNTGTAAEYDLRYSISAIADSVAWENASPDDGTPSPSPAGSEETHTITGLTPGTQYWFAIAAEDEEGNTSAFSNIDSAVTTVPDSFTGADYFPMHVGDSWVYNLGSLEVEAETLLAGIGTGYVLRASEFPCAIEESLAIWTNAGDSIVLHTEDLLDPLVLLKSDMDIGDTWEVRAVPENPGEEPAIVRFTFEDTTTVADAEVTAGTFPGCIQLRVHLAVDPPWAWTDRIWFAKDVGIVKVERVEGEPEEGCFIMVTSDQKRSFLQSATVGENIYP